MKIDFGEARFGITAGVTYIVLSSSGTTITVGAHAGAGAISTTGAYSGNVFAVPLPFASNTGATPPGLRLNARGAFILSISDPATSDVCDWVASDGLVTICPRAALTGTGGATTMTGTGLPPMLSPVAGKNFLAAVENNTAAASGMGNVSTVGALSFYTSVLAGAWTASGTKALLSFPMTWPLL